MLPRLFFEKRKVATPCICGELLSQALLDEVQETGEVSTELFGKGKHVTVATGDGRLARQRALPRRGLEESGDSALGAHQNVVVAGLEQEENVWHRRW